ncbi:MAG: S8 family serine peptidase, partial [Acidobacteria bacterium]|nr:S8 family serine peptidase [Acidobacteriota bacterium]
MTRSWTRTLLAVLLPAATMASSLAAAPASEDRGRVLLDATTIDARRPAPVAEGLSSGSFGDGGEYQLVKFAGTVRADQRRRLEAAVERIYTYLPDDTFLVKLKSGVSAPALAAAGVRWQLPYHPAYKLSRRVTGLAGTEALSSAPVVLLVRSYPDANLDSVEQRLADLGLGRPVGRAAGRRFNRLRYVVDQDRALALSQAVAQVPEVFFVDLESRRVLLNDTTVWVGQSGVAGGQATPVHNRGILGQGQVVGVLDTGIDPDMCYFRDTMLGLPAINACDGGTTIDAAQRKVLAVDFLWQSECNGGIDATEWDTHDHGTHVAGTVAGDDLANVGVRDPGDGMAPAAKLVIQDGGVQFDNCADLPGLGCPVVDLNPIFQQAYDQGARIHTNSWGDRENFTPHNIYSAGSEDADEFAWNHKDFLLFFAAGNEGNTAGTVGSPATGKNVVAVGATRRGSSAEQLA